MTSSSRPRTRRSTAPVGTRYVTAPAAASRTTTGKVTRRPWTRYSRSLVGTAVLAVMGSPSRTSRRAAIALASQRESPGGGEMLVGQREGGRPRGEGHVLRRVDPSEGLGGNRVRGDLLALERRVSPRGPQTARLGEVDPRTGDRRAVDHQRRRRDVGQAAGRLAPSDRDERTEPLIGADQPEADA